MKKKIMYFGMVVSVVTIAALNVSVTLDANRLRADATLASIEAISDDESGEISGGGASGYTIHRGDCTISQTIALDGTITLFGKKYKVSSIGIGGVYSREWKNASTDCSINGKFLCTPYTCAQLYEKQGSFQTK